MSEYTDSLDAQILDEIEKQGEPRSAKQIAVQVDAGLPAVRSALRRLVARGSLAKFIGWRYDFPGKDKLLRDL